MLLLCLGVIGRVWKVRNKGRIILIALVFIYNGIMTSIVISKSILNKVPNVISSLILLICFISYTVMQLKCEFLEKVPHKYKIL